MWSSVFFWKPFKPKTMSQPNTHLPLGSIPKGARSTPPAPFQTQTNYKASFQRQQETYSIKGSPSICPSDANCIDIRTTDGSKHKKTSTASSKTSRSAQVDKTPTDDCASQIDIERMGHSTSQRTASSHKVSLIANDPQTVGLFQNLDKRMQNGNNSQINHNIPTDEDTEDLEDSAQTDSVLSVYFASGNLGVAFFDESNAEISLGQLPDSTNDFLGLRTVLFQFQPSIIITNTKLDAKFEAALRAPGDGISYRVDFCSEKDFKYEESRVRLLRLSVDGSANEGRYSDEMEIDNAEKCRLISSMVNLDAVQAVCAAGGLLAYIEGHKLIDELSEGWSAAVTKIKTIQLEEFLAVDPETMFSLQIFANDVHPSLAGSGRDKEGLSIFSFLDYTKSLGGRNLLRLWFCRFFSQPGLHDLVGSIRQELAQVKNIPRMMMRMRQVCICLNHDGIFSALYTQADSSLLRSYQSKNMMPLKLWQSVSSVNDWLSLDKSLFSLASIKEMLHQTLANANIAIDRLPVVIQKVLHKLCPKILNIARMLQEVIDFEESKLTRRIVINHGIDDNLDEEKRQYDGLADFLNDVAREEVDGLPEYIDLKISVIFCPQLGYLLVTPNDGSPGQEQLSRMQDIEMLFHSQAYIYWKTARTRQLDEEIGDIYARICDQEFNMANQLREKLLEYHDSLLESYSIASELDCILSFTVAAIEHRLTEPSLVEKPVLYIQEGRHPLCEAVVDVFVPNDTVMDHDRDEGTIHIVTGPNSSGKSIYLKQVAIITFMAHIGSWVPAQASEIGLVDRIFTRVQSRETCSTNNSSFAIDLNQVAVMIRGSTKRSLLLIDEFGKGTHSLDGIALLAAAICEFAGRERECPRSIIATHFSELFTVGGVLKNSQLISFYTMSVMTSDKEAESSSPSQSPSEEAKLSELVFLYRLVPGRTADSRGFRCALSAGLPNPIVERAKVISSKIYRGEAIERLESRQDHEEEQRCRRLVGLLWSSEMDCVDLSSFFKEVNGISSIPAAPLTERPVEAESFETMQD